MLAMSNIPCAQDLKAIAVDLVPLLRKNATQTDQESLVPEENLILLRESGLLSLGRPSIYGGSEGDLETLLATQVILAQGCGSTSWVAGLGNLASYLIGLFPAEAQHDVWGTNPNHRITCVTSTALAEMTEVEGGWQISGKWRYASGCMHAQWAVVGVPTKTAEGKPDVGLALLPMSEVKIEKNWDVIGMRGTGSHTLVIENAFIPTHRQQSYAACMAGNAATAFDLDAHPMYRLSFTYAFGLCLAATPVGLAKAALDESILLAPKRNIPLFNIPQSAASSVQTFFGNAAMKTDSADLHLMRAAKVGDEAALKGIELNKKETLQGHTDGIAASQYATEAIRLLNRAQMSGSFANSNPLQRMWRDCEVASSHFGFAEMFVEMYGQSLLNMDAND